MRRHHAYALVLLLIATMASPQAPMLTSAAEDLAAFVDGMFDIQLKRDDAAGAALLLRQNDITLLSHGYGYADISRHIPMTSRTIVRAGALTMPVIAVAVMQQVEEGKLSLDDDISRYLDFPLEGRNDGFITLRHLLTHTAGFTGKVSSAPANDLRVFLTQHPPQRTYPAGALNSYSPYGMDLAACIVERVSGEKFPAYAQRHIFTPLRMTQTTLVQPLPFNLLQDLSQGYGSSTQPPIGSETLELALSLSTTAEDMGSFGDMLVHGGTLNGHQILTPASVASILARQTTTAPDLSPGIPAMGLAFHQVWFNGSRLFGHSGDTAAFHVELEIDPERRLVLFLAYNSAGHPGLPGEPSKLVKFSRGELIHGIFDRYQPFHPKVISKIAPSPEEQQLATGTWLPADAALTSGHAHLVHTEIDPRDGSLVVDSFVSDRGTVKHWLLLSPNLWQQYPQDRIYAIKGRDGLPDRLALAADPANQLVRAPGRVEEPSPTRNQRPQTSLRPATNR